MQARYVRPLYALLEVKVKFLVFVLLFFYVIGLFVVALSTFRSDDPIPDVKMISFEMRKQFRDLASRVKVGLYVRNFSTFNFITNSFVVNAMIWFEFNQNEIMLNTINQFSFENSKILHKSDPYVTLNNGKMLVQYDVMFETKTDINFYRFPLEDHRLSIVLTNNFISPNEMYFDDSFGALSFIVSDRLFTSDWDVHALRSVSGYTALSFDKYAPQREMLSPKAVFTIDFQKAGVNKILLIFVPLFAAILLALFSFLMSFNNHNGKATVGLTAITALLGYRFVIQQMSPPVGYFTLTDKIFTFFLLFAFLIYIFHVLLSRHYFFLEEHEKIKRSDQPETDLDYLPPRITERINAAAYYVFVSVFVFVVTYIIMV
ncbi:MAG: hypothetical protein WCW33_03825 [Candidatus Babeliales bacterium]|jgi:hypothetical protein